MISITATILIFSIIVNIILFWYFYMTFFVVNPRMENDLENLSEFVNEMRKRLEISLQRLRQVDIRGAFESDDEIGFVFKYIKNEMKAIDDMLTINKNDNKQNE
jgi:hypothetical protein